MENMEYRRLDKSKLKNRKRSVLSSEEALKDVVPVRWNKDMLNRTVSLVVSK